MAIKTQDDGTDVHLRDSRFHLASLRADPAAKRLVDRTAKADKALREAAGESDNKDGERLDAWALFIRSDVNIDTLCRKVEVEVFGRENKNRGSTVYRGCFPNGLTDLVAMRGDEQARAVGALVTALGKYAPEIGKKHKAALTKLAKETTQAEEAWKEAELAYATAFAEERIARTGLTEQLRKNEGALREMYPGQTSLVRSFFRPDNRKQSGKAKPAPASQPAPTQPST